MNDEGRGYSSSFMRAFFIVVVCSVLSASCLPWDPRADGPTAGGVAGGGAAGGSAAGGLVAGGAAAAGGTGMGVVTPYADGGCLTFDGGTRCHPLCVPGLVGLLGNGESCCLDDECASRQCFGAWPGRLCAASTLVSIAGGDCGDSSDCATRGGACDRFTQRCSATITAIANESPTPCTIEASATSCAFGAGGPFCALPGTRNQSMGSNPCCYDRTDAGDPISCLATGACYCLPPDDAGFRSCGAYEGASCPF